MTVISRRQKGNRLAQCVVASVISFAADRRRVWSRRTHGLIKAMRSS